MEEKSEGGRRPRSCQSYEDLGDIVLSWSLDQILDEGLFENQVEKLPSTFYSVGHYLKSFSVPLMEETRSDLCSSLSDISNAPCSRIISKEKGKKKRHLETTLEYFIDVEFFKNYADGSNKNYKARNGDLFILSNIELQAVEDLYRHSVTYCFALVTEVTVDEGITRGFAVNISKDADLEDGISNYSFACFVTNLLTCIRIWKVLAHAPGMNSNFRIIQEVLSPKPMMTVRDSPNISQEVDNLLTKLTNTFSLNQSQINAVRTVIHATGGTASNFVELIWGPPGTGKTKTVTAMLWLFLRMQCRTLICAPTNVAVVGVCCRLLQLVEDIRMHDGQHGLPLSLSNIVLFGNRDRMEIHDELQDVFLDHRVDQLLGCLGPSTGWRHRISSAIQLFEDCSSTFEMFVENRPEKMEESFDFSEFLRKRFDAVMDPVKDCILNLRIHTNYISSQNAAKISVLLGLLEKMRTLIWNTDLDDVKLREVFSQDISSPIVLHDTVSSAHGFCTSKELLEARVKVVHLLKQLQSTLSLPDKLDKNFIRNFCIRNATIIFCTVSSSSMLHYLDMDPLQILVIDEAAQLKECESVIPLRLNGLRCAILVGDECQLPAMIKSQICKDAGFGVSLFERLASVGQRKHLLNIQYRMHPLISFFPNFRFYRKQIQDGPNVLNVDYNANFKDLLFGPYAFVNVADGREEMEDKSVSKRNMVEVAVVCFLVEILYKHRKSYPQVLSIGVISPYVYQIKAIKDKLGSRYESEAGFDVRVNSIDGFQGEENDVIILSTVRSNLKGNIGFLHDFQRTNVALTRARHCLWIVGNANTLARSGTTWENIVNDAKERCCFYNAKDNANLAKVILHVKHEFDQLDDLLRSDSVFLSNARWKVLFSDDFKISFAKLRQIQCKMQVIKLLENLAEGWRSKLRFEEFSGSLELIRVNKVNDFYVIWTVDIKKDDRYIQVLKVWDILPLEQIARLVSRLDHIFSLYTETYVNYCKYTCTQGKLEVPMSWNVVQDIVCYKALSQGESTDEVSGDMDLLMVMENSKVSESLVLMKFYSLSFGVARHMLTASDGTELDIPFELTDQEKEIVRFPLSTFILGRSGTGKTTILTMKLIQKEQVFSISSDGPSDSTGSSMVAETGVLSTSKTNFLKQVFITVSPKLCSAIMSHARRLQSFASGVEVVSAASSHYMHDNNELSDFHGIPDSFCNLQHQHFPLVITFRKFLLMLDGTMSRSFFDKYYSQWGVSPDQNGGPKSFALQAFIQSKEVNYEKFFRSYWLHFDEQLTKMVDPSTVFTQIISHIKGGLHSGMVHTGRLSREEYLLLSEKRVSTLSQQSREIIYEIFIDYESQKLLASEYDLTDFTNYLHYQLCCDGYVGDMIDFVYIDEVQDLTMRQIALLKYVCRNFEEGYTFAGDTAQTIARGIDFRFQDIRSLFYTEFLSELKSKQPQKETEIHMADMFHLNQNFRTHAGILSLAQSIMVILYYYFPQSVDKLDPEFSLVYGEAPVLLESDNDENVILTIFGNSGSMLSSSNGFGAEQVILVRDSETKEQICSLVGKQALVLTILECKGLEFQDVLLYNFFGTSPLKRRWRVIYEYMEKHGILDPSLSRAFSSFRSERHNILCSELKQLYVAITRTKQRLWISENADEYCKPMFDYWKKLGLVQVRHLDASIAQAMKSSSSAEDWRNRGIKLFNEGNFELATMCFEKAGDEFNEKWAKAAGLVANAELIISTNFDMAERALKNAAEIYVSIGKPDSAATCYIKSKDFKSAGNIYIEKCGMSRLKDAGDCFAMAKCWALAADAYAGGKFFSDCLLVCSRGRIYDTGLQKIEQWKGASLSNEQLLELNNLISPFLKNCLVHYLELGDIQKVLMYAKTFRSSDTHEEHLILIRKSLKSKDLFDSLLLIEQELGNYLEAAAIAKFMGNIPLEVEMLEKAKCFEEAARLLIFHVLVRSLWSQSSNGWPLKGFAEKKELLMKAKELSKHKEGSFEEFVNLEASILSDGSKSLVDMAKHLVQAQKHGSLRQEVFSARTILDAHIEGNPHKFFCQVQVPFSNFEKLAYYNMSQNHLTLETMMYTWNLWKEIIVNLLCYLQLPNETREYCCRYEEFYLEYFGVRTVDNDRYAVQNPEANWVKKKYSLRREKNLVFITTDECESCAMFYWCAELFAVGMKVLDSLGNLHSLYNSKLAYSSCRAKVAISMYEIAKFLMTSDFTASRNTSKMERYLCLSQRYYLETVTPLDWKNDTMENVRFLRENKIALEIIDAALRDNLKPWNGNLSHGQIGRLVALLLVTGKLPDVLFEEIRGFLRGRQQWKDFIEQYKIFLDQGFGRIPLLNRFQIALEKTFNSPNWGREKDYMSPHHFISLMEKLMFIASSCQGFKGNVFTTKYSLLEILKCQGCSGFLTTCLPAISVDFKSSVQSTLDFISATSKRILNDRKQLLDWISNSNMSRESHSILALRLVILLLIGCLNSGRSIHQAMRFLFLNNHFSYLPRPFSKRLESLAVHMAMVNTRFIEVFAEALVSIENPLVVILSQGCRSTFSNLNALTIDSEDIKCHQKVCSLLFPEKQPISHAEQFEGLPFSKSTFEISSLNTTKQDINSIPSTNPEELVFQDVIIDNQSESLPIKESSFEIDSSNAICQNIESIPSEKTEESILGFNNMDKQSVQGDKDVDVELTEECKQFWQKTKGFLSGEHDDVEGTISLLGTVLRWMQQKAETKEFDEHLITEMVDMRDRIKLLASMVHEGTQVGYPTKDDLLAIWIGLRASMEPLLETFFPHCQSTMEEACPSDNKDDSDENNSDCDPNIHEAEAEAKTETSSTNQTKASKHQKKKAWKKKGKGKGKKKK